MTANQPNIPNRLASRILAAQGRIDSVRQESFMTIRTLEQSENRKAEHDCNPDAFAARYYLRCGGIQRPLEEWLQEDGGGRRRADERRGR